MLVRLLQRVVSVLVRERAHGIDFDIVGVGFAGNSARFKPVVERHVDMRHVGHAERFVGDFGRGGVIAQPIRKKVVGNVELGFRQNEIVELAVYIICKAALVDFVFVIARVRIERKIGKLRGVIFAQKVA